MNFTFKDVKITIGWKFATVVAAGLLLDAMSKRGQINNLSIDAKDKTLYLNK